MSLKEKINLDIKEALKSGDKLRLSTVRSIRALILEFEKSGSGKEFNKEEEIKLLSTAAKKRKESIEQYRNAGREDLASVEEAELKVIMGYLPKQLDEKEVEEIVCKLAKETGAVSNEDFRKLMPAAMKELKGRADGKVVKAIVEKVLSEN